MPASPRSWRTSRRLRVALALAAALGLVGIVTAARRPAIALTPPQQPLDPSDTAGMGPLRVSARNPRYFERPDGRIVYLTGSHTWSNLQDNGVSDPPPAFDYAAYLRFLRAHDHNFFRLWAWEQFEWTAEIKGRYAFDPVPYERPGPGVALDGKPKADLTRFNPAYFARLRERVRQAREEGIYVSVMLFDGWSLGTKGTLTRDNPWKGHPFNGANNINGIEGDGNRDGFGYEIETLADTAITRLQEAYVRQVIDAVNDFDNVLYEITNEGQPDSRAWQYHMIEYVRAYEATRPRQHPVGMTSIWPDGSNADLFASPADWIAPMGPLEDRPAASGHKVVLSDTDQLCGTCGSIAWVWRSFTSGENPALMDGYDGAAVGVGASDYDRGDPKWEPIRRNLGFARTLARRLPLDRMIPRPDLASTGFCLAATEDGPPVYVVFAPAHDPVTVDLTDAPGRLAVTWLDTATGALHEAGEVTGRATRTFASPSGDAQVLFLH